MGSHYGVKIRKLESAALKQQRSHYPCPVCGKPAVKRSAFALWKCRSCGAEIAGGAYSLGTDVGTAAKKALSSATPL